MTSTMTPPPKYIKEDGKMIYNPEYRVYTRMRATATYENDGDGDSDSDSDSTISDNDDETNQQIQRQERLLKEQEELENQPSRRSKIFDHDGIEIPPKFIRQQGKVVYNPEYISYMKGGRSSNSIDSTKLNALTEIIDLSKDFPMADTEQPLKTLRCNPGARWIESHFGGVLGGMAEVYRVTVIENGKLVADYRKNGVGPDDKFNLFSTTKGMLSMILGVVMEQTDLTPEHTLEQVFRNNPKAWKRLQNNPKELEYKKSVTIHELLTMTSGLISMVGGYKGILTMKELSVADAAGSDVSRALAAPQYNPKNRGIFNYMPSSNILSYVIKETTGVSPLEFANRHVFPKLGIHPHKLSWDSNAEGIQTSYSQLKLTTYQMCKVGQLYLQDGYHSPRAMKPIFGDDWIQKSHRKHVYGEGKFDHWYGYLWSLYDRNFHSNLQAGDIWCAPGFNGQLLAISRETNRAVAISRFPAPMDGKTLKRYKKYVIKLLGKTMSYSSIETMKRSVNCQIPLKYIRKDGKMVVNPDYVQYMNEQKQRSEES